MVDLSRVFATITTLNLRFAEKFKGASTALKTLFERNDLTGLHHLSLSHDSAVTAQQALEPLETLTELRSFSLSTTADTIRHQSVCRSLAIDCISIETSAPLTILNSHFQMYCLVHPRFELAAPKAAITELAEFLHVNPF